MLIKDIFEIGTGLSERYQKWKDLGDDANAEVRFLYLECKRNLAIRECMDTSEKQPSSIEEIELLSFAPLLETGVSELIFLDGEKSVKLLTILAKQRNLSTEVAKFETTVVNGGRNKPKTLLKIAMFVYTRVHFLKKVSQLVPKKSLFKPPQYKNHLLNIKSSYLTMLKGLHEHQAVKTFSNI